MKYAKDVFSITRRYEGSLSQDVSSEASQHFNGDVHPRTAERLRSMKKPMFGIDEYVT